LAAEVCFDDDIDNDGDGRIDCADSDCQNLMGCLGCYTGSASFPCPAGTTPITIPAVGGTTYCWETDCFDGIDNDCDGMTDCDDASVCANSPFAGPALIAHCIDSHPEVECSDGVDNDEDGLTDCDDPDCDFKQECFYATPPPPPPSPGSQAESDCTDGIDNDGDGLVDCPDSNCASDPACYGCYWACLDAGCSRTCHSGAVEVLGICYEVYIPYEDSDSCQDGIDNDCDGLIDCADRADLLNCLHSLSPISGVCDDYEHCNDGYENDGDSLTDCADPDCDIESYCDEICDNGIDDNGDGDVDCDDRKCATLPPGEDCTDGVDNDCDTKIDCSDPNCIGDPACVEVCNDQLDNDLDGLIDCADIDCTDNAACPEICDDKTDNDADGDVDCADSECRDQPVCIGAVPELGPALCNDGQDNDKDGSTDCADSDCQCCATQCPLVVPSIECGRTELQQVCFDGWDNDCDGTVDDPAEDCLPYQ